jgi:hypothetical protein
MTQIHAISAQPPRPSQNNQRIHRRRDESGLFLWLPGFLRFFDTRQRMEDQSSAVKGDFGAIVINLPHRRQPDEE